MTETPVSLLDQLRQNPSEAAWKRFVDLYTPLLERWLGRFGLRGADADDLLQETLTAVFRALPTFEHRRQAGAFRRWLRTTLSHRVLPFFRAQKRQPAGLGTDDVLRQLQELEDPNSGSSRQWDEEHDRYVISKLLEMIRAEFQATTWRAFEMLGLEGASPREAAEALQLSPNAAIIAKCRVLNRLRQLAMGLVDT